MTGTIELDIPGVELKRTLPGDNWEHHLTLTFTKACEGVSSAPLNGGFGLRRAVVNRSVPKNWTCDDPETEMAQYVARLGLSAETTVGLITAVSMADVQITTAERSGWRVHSLITAGVGNAAAAGGRFTGESRAGTVNIIVLLGGSLTPAALIGGVQSATEAKTAAFRKAGVMTRFSEPATGTTTDTVTLVNLNPNPRSLYAGLATIPGSLIAETVYTALLKALPKN